MANRFAKYVPEAQLASPDVSISRGESKGNRFAKYVNFEPAPREDIAKAYQARIAPKETPLLQVVQKPDVASQQPTIFKSKEQPLIKEIPMTPEPNFMKTTGERVYVPHPKPMEQIKMSTGFKRGFEDFVNTIKELPRAMGETTGFISERNEPFAQLPLKEKTKLFVEALPKGAQDTLYQMGEFFVTAPLRIARSFGVPLPQKLEHPTEWLLKKIGREDLIKSHKELDLSSYQEQVNDKINQGVSPAIAVMDTAVNMLFDFSILGGITEGVKFKLRQFGKPAAGNATDVLVARQTLGVTEKSSPQEIKQAYYQIARETHPDLVPGKQEQFIAANKAYQALTGVKPKYYSLRKVADILSRDITKLKTEAPPARPPKPEEQLRLTEPQKEPIKPKEEIKPIEASPKPPLVIGVKTEPIAPITAKKFDEIKPRLLKPEEAITKTPSDLQDRWYGAYEFYETNIETPLVNAEKELKQELETLKPQRTKEAQVRKKEINTEINNIKERIAQERSALEEEHMQFGLDIAKQALRVAKEKGIDVGNIDDPLGGVTEKGQELRDEILTRLYERPYIETNYRQPVKEIIDEVVNEYAPQQKAQPQEKVSLPNKNDVAESVVQVVDATGKGKDVFYTIRKEDFDAINNKIDTGKPIAGEVIDGKQWHLTASPPEKMIEAGFEYKGMIAPDQIPASKKIVEPTEKITIKKRRGLMVGQDVSGIKPPDLKVPLRQFNDIPQEDIALLDKRARSSNYATLRKEYGLEHGEALKLVVTDESIDTLRALAKERTATKKEYVAIVDQPDNRGKFWSSGTTRKLTSEEAKLLLEKGKIKEYEKPESKRMVEMTEADGTKKTLTWGEYLKRRASQKSYKKVSPPEKEIVPPVTKEITDYLQTKYGKTFEKATKSEIKEALRETKVPIFGGEELLKRVASAESGIDKKAIFETRTQFLGNIAKGDLTDGYILIRDKEVVDNFYNDNVKKIAQREARKLAKMGANYDEAYKKEIARLDKEKQENIKQAPDVENVIPEPSKENARILGYQMGQYGADVWVIVGNDKTQAALNPDKLAFVRKNLPGTEMRIVGSEAPIQFVKEKTIKGLVMPIRTEGFDFSRYVKPEKQAIIEKTEPIPSGIASAGGAKMGAFEKRGLPQKGTEEFKLFNEVKNLIQKYAKSVGEDYLPRKAEGVYYPGTKNIRLKGMNALSVAAHEITHFLDFAYKISDRLQGIKGYAINGNPIYERGTLPYRKEITSVYEKYYPGGKRTHSLKKRMLEGFATLLQKYIEQPTIISGDYPNIVKEFLQPGGKFYENVIGDIVKDLNDIVARYQELTPLKKINARIMNDEVNVDKKSFLNVVDKIRTEVADNIYPIEKLSILSGKQMTSEDPSLFMRLYNASSAIILQNINGKRWGYYHVRNGELVKLHDFNYRTIIATLEKQKTIEDFASFLVARREYFLYQELKGLAEKAEGNTEVMKSYAALKGVLDKDGFTEQEVTAAYNEGKDRFIKETEMFDVLVEEDLKFLHDSEVQLIDGSTLLKLQSREGYASFKRAFYDEIAGEEEGFAQIKVGKTKVSSLLRRKGSEKAIINPLYSALKNHAEVTRKGLKQIIYNKMGGLAGNFPDLFQPLQLEAYPDQFGRIIYPQEKDPQIIMARKNYKRYPILTDSFVKRTVDEVLNFQNISIFEQLLLASARYFTKGTTGLFPGFTFTNFAIDQATAAAQTQNRYFPVASALKHLAKGIINKQSLEYQYLVEYLVMGGDRQTFVGWQDLSPNELFTKITKERKGILKVADMINSGVDILAVPAKYSEILTRATEYIKSRKEGKSTIVALEEAGRVTAPFHHVGRLGGGRVGKVIIKSIPFFNPAIQVLDQAFRTIGSKKGRKRYGFVTMTITASLLAGMWLLVKHSTDEQRRLYTELSPEELLKNVYFPHPNGKDLIKIRVPDQMAVLGIAINMSIANRTMNADYTMGDYVNAGTAWLPTQLDPTDIPRSIFSWIPQIVKPALLTIVNKKDFPKIVPLEGQSMQGLPSEYRETPTTSFVAKKLAKTGVAKKLDLSPIKIDYLLQGYFGRAIGFVTIKKNVYNPFSVFTREEYFYGSRQLDKYYRIKEQNDQDYRAVRNKLKQASSQEVRQLLTTRGKIKQIEKHLEAYRKIDIEKNETEARKLRGKIINLINTL